MVRAPTTFSDAAVSAPVCTVLWKTAAPVVVSVLALDTAPVWDVVPLTVRLPPTLRFPLNVVGVVTVRGVSMKSCVFVASVRCTPLSRLLTQRYVFAELVAVFPPSFKTALGFRTWDWTT